MMPDALRILVRWLGSWNRPRSSDLPPPVVPVTDVERKERSERLRWVKAAGEQFDREVDERITRLEALAETLRSVAHAHSDTDRHPIIKRRA